MVKRPSSALCAVCGAAAAFAAALWLAGCAADIDPCFLPVAGYRPPGVLEAGPLDERNFRLRFDEPVTPVEGTFAYGLAESASVPPRGAAMRNAAVSRGAALPPPELLVDGAILTIQFREPALPGRDYLLAGEVADERGNSTRFSFCFTGWNARPPRLAFSELRTARNSSTTNPHRDYLELIALSTGNLGGVELAYASSSKLCTYRLPPAEVTEGEFILLHFAPEGLATERDEAADNLAASGGIDAQPYARDFWCAAGGIPDATGALALRPRPGAAPVTALFYAEESKTGPVGESKLGELLVGIGDVWPFAGPSPAYEDAFRWKPSTAKTICARGGAGPAAWFLSAQGGETPGAPNAAAP